MVPRGRGMAIDVIGDFGQSEATVLNNRNLLLTRVAELPARFAQAQNGRFYELSG